MAPDCFETMDQQGGTSGLSRYMVIDLEATCWKGPQLDANEIIEIGAVLYETGKGCLDEFQIFVKPRLQPVLSDFCVELTGIQQSDIDVALPFVEAFSRFRDWAADQGEAVFASWGAYDRKQMLHDCVLNGVQPWDRLDPHLNLKRAFSILMDCTMAPSLSHALQVARLDSAGAHHRGLDDARSIARVLEYMIRKFGDGKLWEAAR